MTETEAADEAACKLDGMFRDLFSPEDRRDLIYVIITASDAYRAEQRRKNCKHHHKTGVGSLGSGGGGWHAWHCPECGASYDSRSQVVPSADREGGK